jgi:Flp pilus assembly protein TadG
MIPNAEALRTRPPHAPARWLRERGHERGAVIVEFAIVFPVLAMLLFGMFSGGMVMNRRATITQASREGARYGATVAFDQCIPTTLCAGRTWAQQVRSVAVSRASGTVTASNVCVALVSGSGTAPTAISSAHTTKGGTLPCYADQSADTGRRVQVVITFSDEIQAVLTRIPVNVTAKATSKLEA